jgi:hypothetical protein
MALDERLRHQATPALGTRPIVSSGGAARRVATSFCEYADTKPRKTPKWFALARRARPQERADRREHELFGFSTTEANAVVAPIHPKAMPVILTTPEEVDLWLLADAPKALELQRPLPDDVLMIVASGEREDGPREPPSSRNRASNAVTPTSGVPLHDDEAGHLVIVAAVPSTRVPCFPCHG